MPGSGLLTCAAYAWLLIWLWPSVPFGDPGEVIAAGWTLGNIHYPGAPPYMLIAKAFTFLPLGSIASRLHLLSVLCGAVIVVLITGCAARLSEKIFDRASVPPDRRLFVGLSFVFFLSLPHGIQLFTYAEVTPLLFALLIGCFFSVQVSHAHPTARSVLMTSLTLGFLLSVKLETAVFLPLIVWLLIKSVPRPSRVRFTLALLVVTAVAASSYLAQPIRASRDPAVNFGRTASVGRLARGYFEQRFPEARMTGLLSGRFPAGIKSRADEIGPAIERWVTRRSPDFAARLRAKLGSQLRADIPALAEIPSRPPGPSLADRLDSRFYRKHFEKNFVVWLLPLAGLGLFIWGQKAPASLLLWFLPVLVFHVSVNRSETIEQSVYAFPLEAMLGIAVLVGIVWLVRSAGRWIPLRVRLPVVAVTALWMAWTHLSLAINAGYYYSRENYFSDEYREKLLDGLPAGAVLLSEGSDPLFMLWYLQYVENRRPDVLPLSETLLASRWYREEVRARHSDVWALARGTLTEDQGEKWDLRERDRRAGEFVRAVTMQRPIAFTSYLRKEGISYRRGAIAVPEYRRDLPLTPVGTSFRVGVEGESIGRLSVSSRESNRLLDDDSKRVLHESLLDRAHWAAAREDPTEAQGAFERLVQIDPSNAFSHYHLGVYLLSAGDPERAANALAAALARDPLLYDAYVKRCLILVERGQSELALDELEKLIEINPRYAHAYNNRGNLRLMADDIQGAERDYLAALRWGPDERSHWNNAIRLYHLRGDSRTAQAFTDEFQRRFSRGQPMNGVP